MGDNAEMILDGILDMYTGEYISDSVGYPRTYHRTKTNRFKKTSNKDLRGIRYFASRFAWIKNTEQCNNLILEYGKVNAIAPDISLISQVIQKDFKPFKQFILNYSK